MRAHAMAGLRLRRRVRTTIPEPADQKVPDLLRRDFTAPAPNQRYVGDITLWVPRTMSQPLISAFTTGRPDRRRPVQAQHDRRCGLRTVPT